MSGVLADLLLSRLLIDIDTQPSCDGSALARVRHRVKDEPSRGHAYEPLDEQSVDRVCVVSVQKSLLVNLTHVLAQFLHAAAENANGGC